MWAHIWAHIHVHTHIHLCTCTLTHTHICTYDAHSAPPQLLQCHCACWLFSSALFSLYDFSICCSQALSVLGTLSLHHSLLAMSCPRSPCPSSSLCLGHPSLQLHVDSWPCTSLLRPAQYQHLTPLPLTVSTDTSTCCGIQL